MQLTATLSPLDWVAALMLGSMRLVGCVNFIPAFGRQNLTHLSRNAIALAVGLPYTVAIYQQIQGTSIGSGWLFVLALKEASLGCLIGLLLATPFWAFLSVGVLIDNQRGADAAQQVNPSLPADSSILGDLIERVLVLILVEAGVFPAIFSVISESLRIWPVLEPVPHIMHAGLGVYLDAFRHMLAEALRYAAPILILLLLLEFVFALMSVIVQGMPVHEMAMPIKSLLALVVLSMYATSLFGYGSDDVHEWLYWLRATVMTR